MRLLHIHGQFDPLADAAGTLRMIATLGRAGSHRIVAAEPIAASALAAVPAVCTVEFPDDFPELAGVPGPARLQRIASAMRGHDLVLTHGWGAIDAAMAHTLFRDVFSLPPLVHHEHRLDAAESVRRLRRREWYRRVALGRAAAVIVPSRRLEQAALGAWQQPPARVYRVPPLIDSAGYARKPRPDALPRLIKRAGEKWLGTMVAPGDGGPVLVRALDRLDDAWQLVVLGEGPGRETIRAEALRLQLAHRVHLPGSLPDPTRALGLFDLFVLPAPDEPPPNAIAAAMAAGLAVVGYAAGDAVELLAELNRAALARPGDEAALVKAIAGLAADDDGRGLLGAANRARAARDFDEAAVAARLRAIYAAALRRPAFP